MLKRGFKPYILRVFILILSNSILFCNKLKLEERISFVKDFYYILFPIEEFHTCDPFFNYYENKKHFFSEEFLTDEGTINYFKLIESQKKLEKSPCDPLNKLSHER